MSFLGVLLYPFTVLYDVATRARNYLYNIGYKKAFSFDSNVIGVGNLSVGGTGKSPMVEYLIDLLSGKYKIATLSRGYGRKTRGFRLAGVDDSYKTVGDEPYQFYRKFANIHVAVGEERAVAIPFILAERPDTQVIILDDAYQHRAVKPNINILLTDYNRLFYKDFILPTGRLREARKGANRADIVVVTKCPDDLSEEQRSTVEAKVRKYATNAEIYFSGIRCKDAIAVFKEQPFPDNVFLFTGIANSRMIERYVDEKYNLIGQRHFEDHHSYTTDDINQLVEEFTACGEPEKCILTTEKDMVKLLSNDISNILGNIPVFYLPIETYFLNGGNKFDEQILNSVNVHPD